MKYYPAHIVSGLELAQNSGIVPPRLQRTFDLLGNVFFYVERPLDQDAEYILFPDLPLKLFQEGKKLGLLTMVNSGQ